jgi:hypothetical protein
MQAGAKHPMSLRRRLSGTLAVLAVLACAAIVPASAQGALVDVAQPALDTAAPTAQNAADVVRAVESAAGAGKAPAAPVPAADKRPPRPDGDTVQQTVAPIAPPTGGASQPAGAPAAAAGRLHEPRRAHIGRISASASSAERLTAHRGERPQTASGPVETAAAASQPALHGVTDIDSRHAGASAAPARPASSGLPAPEPNSGLAGSDAAAASASTAFFFGGALALLVAALLLAGPHLRRRFLLPPAVCRPAAFHVVLERPG